MFMFVTALNVCVLASPVAVGRVDTRQQDGIAHSIERDGQSLFLWEKRPVTLDPNRVVVLVHGGTWSGRPNFDLQVEGYSLMDRLTERGWNPFAVDLQGYGDSADPLPGRWGEARDAVGDLEAAVDYILELRNAKQVQLLGLSWGGQVAGLFATYQPGKTRGLILTGTHWGKNATFEVGVPQDRFRSNTSESARSDFREGFYEEGVADAFVEVCLRLDPSSPNGCLKDYAENLPLLEPEKIRTPCLVMFGEEELVGALAADSLLFFLQLPSPNKELVVLGGAGHAVHLEKSHDRWADRVLTFLEAQVSGPVLPLHDDR